MRINLVWLLFFTLLRATAHAQSVDTITLGTEHALTSQLLGEQRHYLISLPASYQKDELYAHKKYPVLILLDAEANFHFVSSMIQFMSAPQIEQVPEMIVVALRNTNRTHDMTAGVGVQADKFLDFLESELLPHLDRQYRTLPYRVLVGHSLAGLFALNCFLRQRCFQAYIMIDPTLTWAQNAVLKQATSVLTSNQAITSTVFVAQANNPFDPGQHTGVRGHAFDRFRALLATNQSKTLTHQDRFYPQENHYSVPFPGIRDGLQFVFRGYEFPLQTFLERGSSSVFRHYKLFGDRLGTSLLPPGKVINQMGQFLLHSQLQVDRAIALLSLNETYYPNSVLTYNSLGEAYRLKGDKLTARCYYEKSLALETTNEQATQAIKSLN